MKLVKWHKKIIKQIQEKFNISDYQLLWLAFLEGVLLTTLVIYLTT